MDQAVKHIPGMSETDAMIYFMTYKNLLQEVDAQYNIGQATSPDTKLHNYQVDVRCFGLFIALQLFSQTAKMMGDARTNLEKDPWGIKEHMGGSVTSSPRSKATRSSYAQSEY